MVVGFYLGVSLMGNIICLSDDYLVVMVGISDCIVVYILDVMFVV